MTDPLRVSLSERLRFLADTLETRWKVQRSADDSARPNFEVDLPVRELDATIRGLREAAEALVVQPEPQTSTLQQTLELDGPEPAPIRVAGFLRHYAGMLRVGKQWDIPETMARAYESAALVLEKYHAESVQPEPQIAELTRELEKANERYLTANAELTGVRALRCEWQARAEAAEQRLTVLRHERDEALDFNLRAHRALNDANVPTETQEGSSSKSMFLVDRIEWIKARLTVLEAHEGAWEQLRADLLTLLKSAQLIENGDNAQDLKILWRGKAIAYQVALDRIALLAPSSPKRCTCSWTNMDGLIDTERNCPVHTLAPSSPADKEQP